MHRASFRTLSEATAMVITAAGETQLLARLPVALNPTPGCRADPNIYEEM